ncbi:hypothetical protein KXV85_005895, partial [Aspergillus fumigatus]
ARGGVGMPLQASATRSAAKGRVFSAPALLRLGRCFPLCCIPGRLPCPGRAAARRPALVHLHGAGRRPLGIRSRSAVTAAAGSAARTAADAAGRAKRLHRAACHHPPEGLSAAGSRELDHRRVRLHSAPLRSGSAADLFSRRRRSEGVDL